MRGGGGGLADSRTSSGYLARIKRLHQRLDCNFGKLTLSIGSQGHLCDRRGGNSPPLLSPTLGCGMALSPGWCT